MFSVALPDLLGSPEALSDAAPCRCLDKLLAHRREFFGFLRERWETLFGARFDVLLYDLTSTDQHLLRERPDVQMKRVRYSTA